MLTRLPIMLLAYPEIFLLAAACSILVIDLYLKDATRWITYALSLAALLGCAVLTTIVTGMTGGQLATTFNGMFVSDMMASTLKMFTYIAVALCLVYSRVYMAERGLYRGEYFALALFATLGMMVMISANHFLTLLAEKYQRNISGFAPEAIEILVSAPWPGNVRQLYNVVEQAVAGAAVRASPRSPASLPNSPAAYRGGMPSHLAKCCGVAGP